MCGKHENCHNNNNDMCSCTGRLNRFVQPNLLLALYSKPSYGYELIERISNFYDITPDSAVVYRQLRKLEEEGYVKSEWQVGDIGPAKKYYELTPSGVKLLHNWVTDLEKQKKFLENFLNTYRNCFPDKSN
ncbi:PadR family transcriptional regulator [Aceticella autotrophica]|nr:helix-turn-helix transcriptional regulator [Aceticella autotrophica]